MSKWESPKKKEYEVEKNKAKKNVNKNIRRKGEKKTQFELNWQEYVDCNMYKTINETVDCSVGEWENK